MHARTPSRRPWLPALRQRADAAAPSRCRSITPPWPHHHSRASAFCVQASPGVGPALHILTSQHVTHPYKYRNYYPGEEFAWLDFVQPEHVRVSVEVRDRASGATVFEAACAPRLHGHPDR